MEEKRGVLSHVSGIIRFVVFILVIILLAFFVVRWARDRQTDNSSTETNTTSQNSETESEANRDSEDEDSNGVTSTPEEDATDESDNEDESTTPSGIADGGDELGSGAISSVPSTGLSLNSVMTIALFAITTYLVVKKRQYSKEISNL